MSSTSAKVTLKLLIDKKTNRVVYGEAGKDFVDFLFTILALPLGTVTNLLSKKHMVGTLGNLYQSIEELEDMYMQPKQLKYRVLNPSLLYLPPRVTHLLPEQGLPATVKFYACSSASCSRIAEYTFCLSYCPICDRQMNHTAPIFDPAATNEGANDKKGEVGGFVKSAVAYMVMDNLEVKPISSSMSIMALFNKLKIKDVGSIEEKVIPLGLAEGLSLLKASLETESVLTTVFLGDD